MDTKENISRKDIFLDSFEEVSDTLRAILKALKHSQQINYSGGLSRDEASKFLGVSNRTLHELVTQGKIRRVTVSPGRFVFRRAELERFLEENEDVLVDFAENEVERLFDEAHFRK